MIKILINGYLGKMGKAVEVAVNSSDNFKLVAGVDVNVPSAQESDEVFKNFSDIPKQKLNEVDCVVDFVARYSANPTDLKGIDGVRGQCR